jgi:ribonuclease R
MSDKIGEIFEGVISGVTEWGIFVELVENKCEGLVSVRDLTDDFYELDEVNYCIIGRRSHKRFQLGDSVKVEVYRTNISKKQLDFRLVEIE